MDPFFFMNEKIFLSPIKGGIISPLLVNNVNDDTNLLIKIKFVIRY